MDLPKRKQIRLQNYNYSTPGAYFVTICIQDRRCILSDITVGRCLKIAKEAIERQRLFHLAKIVEKGGLFKP